jgi:hypothetical protein
MASARLSARWMSGILNRDGRDRHSGFASAAKDGIKLIAGQVP